MRNALEEVFIVHFELNSPSRNRLAMMVGDDELKRDIVLGIVDDSGHLEPEIQA